MAEKRKLKFLVVRYVPDAVKGEFVNFGLVTLADNGNGPELIDVRFTKDRSRIFCVDPSLDTDVLDGLQMEIQNEIGRRRDGAVLLKRMEDSFSGVVEISELPPVLTEKTAAEEIEEVEGIFLETPRVKRQREPAGRQRILEAMRNEFEKAGVLRLLHPVPVEPYTKPGDPFEFDFGYRVGDSFKLFHAVSMRASVDSAVMLAARYPKILRAMAQITKTTPLLTAIVEAELDRNRAEAAFALEMMRESTITVLDTAEMGKIAEGVRVDLRA